MPGSVSSWKMARGFQPDHQLAIFADQHGIDGVGLVAAELGAGEIADLGRVDNADDVTRA